MVQHPIEWFKPGGVAYQQPQTAIFTALSLEGYGDNLYRNPT